MIEPDLVEIPAGTFLMGTSDRQIETLAYRLDEAASWKVKGYFAREQPQHTEYLPTYFIGRNPVTVREYNHFIEAEGYLCSNNWDSDGWIWIGNSGRLKPEYWINQTGSETDDIPVVEVSWYEANAYCVWLSQSTGYRYRLPSEAEWEKAARGSDGRVFPWGDEFYSNRCNTRVGGIGRPTPVGKYSEEGDSPYGCADMVGNVSEWTGSRFRSYGLAAEDGDDSSQKDSADEYVTRGGSWRSPIMRARNSARGRNNPWFADDDLGFRLLLDP